MLPAQAGAITNIYDDVSLATAYSGGDGTEGDTVYVNVALATAQEFRAGHEVLLRDTSDRTVDCVGKVTSVIYNGASSVVAVMLLEDDDNSASNALEDADRILVIGNLNPEGGVIPDALAYDPTKYENYTQIFRTPLDITRTARKTRLRTGDAYQEAKREALELHSIEMEKAFIYGIAYEGVGGNGKPERTTQGIVRFITANASGNVLDYVSDTDYSAMTWLQGGEEWLDASLAQLFRYGRQEKLALAGVDALLGVNRLAKAGGQIQLTPMSTDYGIKVTQWITPYGTLYIKTHPLFSYETTDNNVMVVLEPEELNYRYIDDTHFKDSSAQDESGYRAVDGTKEEYLTEAGFEYHHPLTAGILTGVGQPNTA